MKMLLSPVVDVVVATGTCLMLAYGARMAMANELTVGVLVVFLAYLRMMYMPMRDLSKMTDTVSKAGVIGRASARTGAVTLDSNNVSFAACGAGGGAGGAPPPFPGPLPTPTPTPSPSPTPVPTLPEIGAWALLAVLLGGGAYLLSRRPPTDASR